jgi:hypothetical protein
MEKDRGAAEQAIGCLRMTGPIPCHANAVATRWTDVSPYGVASGAAMLGVSGPVRSWQRGTAAVGTPLRGTGP